MTILPEAPNMRDARADYDELKPLMPPVELLGMGIRGRLAVLGGEAESVVFLVLDDVDEVSADAVAHILKTLPLTDNVHLCVDAEGQREDFVRALDAATDGRFKITPVVPPAIDAEVEAAVAAVPLPEGLPGAVIPMVISERDVDRMIRKGETGKHKAASLVRLVPIGEEDTVGTHWRILYWMNSHWLECMFARAFFDHHGIPYQMVQDATDREYAILTDFETATFRKRRDQQRLRHKLEHAKVVEGGDDLEVAFANSSDDDC